MTEADDIIKGHKQQELDSLIWQLSSCPESEIREHLKTMKTPNVIRLSEILQTRLAELEK